MRQTLEGFVRSSGATEDPLLVSDRAVGVGLLNCLRITKGFPRFFYNMLGAYPDFLPKAADIDALFPKPSLVALREGWQEGGGRSALQINAILLPATLLSLKEALFGKEAVSNNGAISDKGNQSKPMDERTLQILQALVMHVARSQQNLPQQLRLLGAELGESDPIEAARVESGQLLPSRSSSSDAAVKALVAHASTCRPAARLDQPNVEIFNLLATQTLRGKVLQQVKKLYGEASGLPLTDIQQHAHLRPVAKSLLLYWQAQQQLDELHRQSPHAISTTIDNCEQNFQRFASQSSQFNQLKDTIQALAGETVSPTISPYTFPVRLPGGESAIYYGVGEHRCLVTERFIHAGKFKLKTKSEGVILQGMVSDGLLMVRLRWGHLWVSSLAVVRRRL
jgi:hypothetical protein